MRKIIIFAILAVALFGCEAGTTGQEVAISSPFIGGSQGLDFQWFDVRDVVFDVKDPFDIVLQVDNKGEWEVGASQAQITLSGINPSDFQQSAANMKQDFGPIFSTRKTLEGQVISGEVIYPEFKGFEHASKVAASVQYPLRADLCYDYGTEAISKFCIRENLRNPRAGGICEPTGSKPVYSSSGPIQVQNVMQTVRGTNKIGLTFDVVNVGGGEVYQQQMKCDHNNRAIKNKVHVKVDSALGTPDCFATSATPGKGTSASEGDVTLYGGKKTITCEMTPTTRADFEQIFTIELRYGYEDTIQTSFTVKPEAMAYPGEVPEKK
ncbi:hypothetical protein KY329_02840 [Candidatus Woesearchaeota archaeon]|nr:hypothetical protein [Candidatus Woesearchaeota archaeon]